MEGCEETGEGGNEPAVHAADGKAPADDEDTTLSTDVMQQGKLSLHLSLQLSLHAAHMSLQLFNKLCSKGFKICIFG